MSERGDFEEGDPFDDPAWKAAEKLTSKPRRNARHIGCSVDWLKLVLPIVHGEKELAVALWLHRRRAVCGSELFTVPNRELYEELGLTRYTKYRLLHRLKAAGLVIVTTSGSRTLTVQFK